MTPGDDFIAVVPDSAMRKESDLWRRYKNFRLLADRLPDLWATFRTGLSWSHESTVRYFTVKAEPNKTPRGRLTATALRGIAPLHVHRAVHRLLEGDVDHPFGRSTGYDLVTPDGRRLPPKAAFGLAIEDALGISVRPNDFYGGEHTPCFAAIRKAGYRIARKGDECPVPPQDPEESAWIEGDRRRVSHLIIERSASAVRNKKKAVRREHGQLICEQCGLVPAKDYGLDVADACIEVHHTMPLADLDSCVSTRLRDLICVCANCHRILHAKLRADSRISSPGANRLLR